MKRAASVILASGDDGAASRARSSIRPSAVTRLSAERTTPTQRAHRLFERHHRGSIKPGIVNRRRLRRPEGGSRVGPGNIFRRARRHHHRLQQRIGREAVRAVKAGAGDLADSP